MCQAWWKGHGVEKTELLPPGLTDQMKAGNDREASSELREAWPGYQGLTGRGQQNVSWVGKQTFRNIEGILEGRCRKQGEGPQGPSKGMDLEAGLGW